jgi:Uma2 family endonuclease
MAISQRGVTLDEFLTWPEEKPALEFINGVVQPKVSPKFRHGSLQGEVTAIVNGHARPRRLAYAIPELRITLHGESLVPDISIFRWERIPRDAAGEPLDDIFVAPDIVIEIASPGQSRRDLVQRCNRYLEYGVEVVLLFQPRDRSVTMFRGAAEPMILRRSDSIDLGDLIPGLQLDLAALFESTRLR